ncbi:hypothetical protein [Psychromonas ossibalaenae]|uniref:hypothetical protein n=1 Tax=Psychromonas ossibalaenae TaxID=444922 RepID=UPI0003664AAC|nr:hypothetical protein [Psychromonas ossibalaenae]
MNTDINILAWHDTAIPHRLWVEKKNESAVRLCMKVIKDVEPEILYLDLPVRQEKIIGAWQGQALAVSDEFNDGTLYSQVRGLLNLSEGCVVWLVNHIQLPDGRKMSADKLTIIPGMIRENGSLIGK